MFFGLRNYDVSLTSFSSRRRSTRLHSSSGIFICSFDAWRIENGVEDYTEHGTPSINLSKRQSVSFCERGAIIFAYHIMCDPDRQSIPKMIIIIIIIIIIIVIILSISSQPSSFPSDRTGRAILVSCASPHFIAPGISEYFLHEIYCGIGDGAECHISLSPSTYIYIHTVNTRHGNAPYFTTAVYFIIYWCEFIPLLLRTPDITSLANATHIHVWMRNSVGKHNRYARCVGI